MILSLSIRFLIVILIEIVCRWGVFSNTLVHVFMYYYYFVATMDVHPWWKVWISACPAQPSPPHFPLHPRITFPDS
jgi:hypothetical protein